ncbi:MAG TPA: DNA repair exonuclease [Candidatus Altiarchaeales archaeon]|nr:DNA repair exonuclease [Candidatus Altiarchaeales archaeon]
MASFIAIGDCHIGYLHRFKTQRLKDYLTSFTNAVQQIIRLKPDFLVITGDLLHHPKPDPVSMRAVVEKLLYMADQFPIIITVGNHEIEGHLGTSYTPIYSSIHPKIHVLTTETPYFKTEVRGQAINIHGFQYLRSRKQAEEQLREISKNVKSGFNLLCIHQAIEGYLEPHEISMRALREAEQKFSMILAGHVHKHQRIKELEKPAYYVGSTERISFNEAGNKTGFMHFKDLWGEPEYVEVESAKMRVIREKIPAQNMGEANQYVREKIRQNKDAKLLKIDVEVDFTADSIELQTDYAEFEEDFTILEVNITPKNAGGEVSLEKMTMSAGLLREYFEKTGVKDEKLAEKCVELYERYGNG